MVKYYIRHNDGSSTVFTDIDAVRKVAYLAVKGTGKTVKIYNSLKAKEEVGKVLKRNSGIYYGYWSKTYGYGEFPLKPNGKIVR